MLQYLQIIKERELNMFRKLLKIIVCLSLIATMILPTVANATYYVFYAGDTNFDDVVDISDVAALRGYIIGIYQPEELAKFLAVSDVNKDESVDIIDVTIVRSTIIGNTDLTETDFQDSGYNLSINDEDYIVDGSIVKDFPQGISFENKTLTLNNANLIIDNENGYGIICDDDLNINLIGENTITCNEDGDVAIGIFGKTNISGDGSLSLTKFYTGILAYSDLNISSDMYVLASMYGIYSDKSVTVNDCRVMVEVAGYGVVGDNVILNNVNMRAEGYYPIISYGNLTVSNSRVDLDGVDAILSYGDVTFDNCELYIYGYPEMGDSSRYVGIASLGNVKFISTQGVVEGTDAAITLQNLPQNEKFSIEFENTKINENYKVNFFNAENEYGPYQYAEITNGDPIYDGEDITNIVTRIELEKAE